MNITFSFARKKINCSFPALFAEAVKLKLVRLYQETVGARNLVLKFLDGFVLKLFDAAATGADQMVVVFSLAQMFIAGLAVTEVNFIGDSRIRKELEGAVNRGVADAGVLGPKLQVKLFYAHVLLGRKEEVEDEVPLASGLESLMGNKIAEYLLFGAFQSEHLY
jgi:hypothetical protein